MSVFGGNDKGYYYVSLGYNCSEGNVMNNWYYCLNFMINVDYKIKFWFIFNFFLIFIDVKWDDGGVGYVGEGNFFSIILFVFFIFCVKSLDGDWLVGFVVVFYVCGWIIVKVYEDVLNYDNNMDKFNLS